MCPCIALDFCLQRSYFVLHYVPLCTVVELVNREWYRGHHMRGRTRDFFGYDPPLLCKPNAR